MSIGNFFKRFLMFFSIMALVVTAFATEKGEMASIYASNAEEISEFVGNVTIDDFNISIDSKTVMPVYKASLYDYARTGLFSISPMDFENGQVYISDVVDATGDFAGAAVFTASEDESEILMYAPKSEHLTSVDFQSNASRAYSLMEKRKIDSKNTQSKFLFVDGLGYVYYINNGTEEVLIAAGLKGTNGNIFNEENKGVVVVDEDFKEKALAELIEYEKRGEELSQLAPGENPETGGNMPAFIVDGTSHFDNTNLNTICIISASILVIICVGLFFEHKSKNNH